MGNNIPVGTIPEQITFGWNCHTLRYCIAVINASPRVSNSLRRTIRVKYCPKSRMSFRSIFQPPAHTNFGGKSLHNSEGLSFHSLIASFSSLHRLNNVFNSESILSLSWGLKIFKTQPVLEYTDLYANSSSLNGSINFSISLSDSSRTLNMFMYLFYHGSDYSIVKIVERMNYRANSLHLHLCLFQTYIL